MPRPEPRVMEQHESSGFKLVLFEQGDLLRAKPYMVFLRVLSEDRPEILEVTNYPNLTEAREYMRAMLDLYLPNTVRALGADRR